MVKIGIGKKCVVSDNSLYLTLEITEEVFPGMNIQQVS